MNISSLHAEIFRNEANIAYRKWRIHPVEYKCLSVAADFGLCFLCFWITHWLEQTNLKTTSAQFQQKHKKIPEIFFVCRNHILSLFANITRNLFICFQATQNFSVRHSLKTFFILFQFSFLLGTSIRDTIQFYVISLFDVCSQSSDVVFMASWQFCISPLVIYERHISRNNISNVN